MKTRVFNSKEELMIALLQGEKWLYNGTICMYSDGYFKMSNMLISTALALELLCDGKTLWTKVEEKTELDLMEEKYASGNYIALAYSTHHNKKNYWYPSHPSRSDFRTFNKPKLIHKNHKDILDAYLADNSAEIEIRCRDINTEWEWIDTNFINNYDEAFEYRLKSKKKTISLAMFTCQWENGKWEQPNVCKSLEDFKSNYNNLNVINHHEIPNTRYEQEIDDA